MSSLEGSWCPERSRLSFAELTKEELKELTALIEKDEKNSNLIVGKNQLTTSAVRKSLHKADDLGNYFFELEHFLGRGLKLPHETETVMATYRRCKRARRK